MEKKIEHSFEELWKLIEGTDVENKWYQVGKKGKVIDLQEQSHDLRSEHLKENRTSRESELVIFGDSITKYIIPENICKCDQQHAVNLSKSGTNHYPGITPKTQLKRYVNYWCVYNISFPTQLFSIPEYYKNLEKNLSVTSIILMNRYSTYVQEEKNALHQS